MTPLPGVGGRLFPSRYLVDEFPHALDRLAPTGGARPVVSQARCVAWWRSIEAHCGSSSGLRTLFDLVAMPLFGMLGFRARSVVFRHDHVCAQLETRRHRPVVLMLLPWAERASTRWRDAAAEARTLGAGWAFVLAPPFLSLVRVHGFATRRSLEFQLPDAFEPASFVRLAVLAHAEAFDSSATDPDRLPLLERLLEAAARYQAGVRDDLQRGVAEALAALTGVLDARQTVDIRRRAAGSPPPQDEALTLVYRILFLLFAESRGLVPDGDDVYRGAYAMSALCREALERPPSFSLWDSLAAATRLSRAGCHSRGLTLHPFNGRLFARAAAPLLEADRPPRRATPRARQRDEAVARALVALGMRQCSGGRETISYRDLGVEQLGAVYERVLDLDRGGRAPGSLQEGARRPAPAPLRWSHRQHSAVRKQTGTFYTPQPLAEFVVRRTLAPLVEGLTSDGILELRVVDPAMGSGAFLVAACRFLADAYGRALVDEGRLASADLDATARAEIRRRIAERCLMGVDRNPVAVQLARLSLWLATLAFGRPLTFLDHRLRVGDSLVGASPDDLARIVPTRRSSHRLRTLPLFESADIQHAVRAHARPLGQLLAREDADVAAVHFKDALWRKLTSDDSPLARWRLAATLWCARWFWPARDAAPPGPAELRALLDHVLRQKATLTASHAAERLATARRIASERLCFHWPLEFPDVFYDESGEPRPRPGFDAVLGNPPWEVVRSDPPRRTGACNRGSFEQRAVPDRTLVRFIRESGLYGLCGGGHLNLYQPFLERSLSLCRTGGRVGLVLPWGLAADTGAAPLRHHLFHQTGLDTLVGLDNASGLFPIHRGMRFLVAVCSPGAPRTDTRARFGVKAADDLDALPGRSDEAVGNPLPVCLTARQLEAISGPALRIPDVRDPRDLTLLGQLGSAHPRLGAPPWRAAFGRELNATESREYFGAHGLPVLEGKHLSPFTIAGSASHRVRRSDAQRLLPDGRFDRPRLGYRDVAAIGNRLSLIAALIPGGVVTTHTIFCLRTPLPAVQQHFLCAMFNSYVLNFIVRLQMGGHLTTDLVESLPVPAWHGDDRDRRIAMLAQQIAGEPGNDQLEAEVQALVARRFGVDEPAFGRILASFPLVPAAARGRAMDALRV
jgi:hypothetical protein